MNIPPTDSEDSQKAMLTFAEKEFIRKFTSNWYDYLNANGDKIPNIINFQVGYLIGLLNRFMG